MTDQDPLESIIHNIANQETRLTSTQAAALILSDGRTDSPEEAGILASGQTLELEKLQQAHLRRMMGFDFVIKIAGSRILCIAKEGPHIITRAKIKPGEVDEYGNITSPELIARLVKACERLKIKWDAEVMRREARK